MAGQTIVLFGESEKGRFGTSYFFQELPELMECLGHPPPESHGLFLAIQALLYKRSVLFFRVAEEGFSTSDYLLGLKALENASLDCSIQAFYLPGVGDPELLHTAEKLCKLYKSVLITSQKDLYDYLSYR